MIFVGRSPKGAQHTRAQTGANAWLTTPSAFGMISMRARRNPGSFTKVFHALLRFSA
jgi:hypothetical protein